jgi:hypothetical protein
MSVKNVLFKDNTMINSEIKATGRLSVVLKDTDGNIKEERDINNLVVTSGLGYIASRMKDATATAMSHMAIGTGTTAAAAGDTTLGTELDRNALTSTTVTSNQIEYVASWSAGDGTGAITEAGIFNAASAGDMLARTVFDVVNKAANDTLSITWTITLSAS